MCGSSGCARARSRWGSRRGQRVPGRFIDASDERLVPQCEDLEVRGVGAGNDDVGDSRLEVGGHLVVLSAAERVGFVDRERGSANGDRWRVGIGYTSGAPARRSRRARDLLDQLGAVGDARVAEPADAGEDEQPTHRPPEPASLRRGACRLWRAERLEHGGGEGVGVGGRRAWDLGVTVGSIGPAWLI